MVTKIKMCITTRTQPSLFRAMSGRITKHIVGKTSKTFTQHYGKHATVVASFTTAQQQQRLKGSQVGTPFFSSHRHTVDMGKTAVSLDPSSVDSLNQSSYSSFICHTKNCNKKLSISLHNKSGSVTVYNHSVSDFISETGDSSSIIIKHDLSDSNSNSWDTLLACLYFLSATFAVWFLGKMSEDSGLITTAKCMTTTKERQHCRTQSRETEPRDGLIDADSSSTDKKERRPGSVGDAIGKARLICRRKKDELGVPGLVVCVSVNGKQVYAEGFGYADLENEVAVRPDSVFRIASISKSVTAVILAKLWEAGKLDLDKTVQHYVPEFPQKYFMGEKVDITIGQLLNHTSGIRHYKSETDPVYAFNAPIQKLVKVVGKAARMPFYGVGPNTEKIQSKKNKVSNCVDDKRKKKNSGKESLDKEVFSSRSFSTTSESLKLFQDDPLLCKPGSKFMYTTHGFTLLSAVAEAIAGKPFTELVTQTLAHLGLSQTCLDKHQNIIYNRARYYMKSKDGTIVNTPYVDNSYKWAGGGLLSTAEDVTKLGNILLYSAQHNENDCGLPGYLKAFTVSKFWSPHGEPSNPRYGLGFEILPEKENYGMCAHHAFGAGHTGSAVGASSILFVLPKYMTTSETTASAKSDESEDKNSSSLGVQGSPSSNILPGCSKADSSAAEKKDAKLPQGVVVTIIVNFGGVSLRPTAHSIARIFDQVDFSL